MDEERGGAGLSRRAALRVLASGAGLALFAACQAPAPASPAALGGAQPTSSTTSPPEQPRRGGSIRAGSQLEVSSLDGHSIQAQDYNTKWAVYDRLISYDDNVKPQPMLAESWDLSSDATQLKLNLRKGVQFHSGRELSSDDIKYNLMRLKDPKIGIGQLATLGSWVTSVETPDKYTAIVHTDQKRPAIFDLFEFLNILDKATIEGPDGRSTMVGTGAFKFVEWVQGDHMTLARNEQYWQAGQPYLDEWRVQVIPDSQSIVTQFEAGALDLVDLAPVRDAARMQKDSRYQVITNPLAGQYYGIIVNTSNPPLDNKLVRQALNYAIDRQRYVDNAFAGQTEPVDLVWPATSPASEPAKNKLYTFDLDRAQALLKQAGVSNLDLEAIYIGTSAMDTALAQIYQADLAKIGIKLILKPLDAAARSAATNSASFSGLAFYGGSFSMVEPSTFFVISNAWAPAKNSASFKNDQYTQLVDAATTEPDPAKRKQVYSQLNDFILDQSFLMMMTRSYTTTLAQPRVRGVKYMLGGGISPREVWLAA
jgi:peptide/nickel transport system substrate-binding protein